MKTSDFYYDLPKELIAQTPLKDRSSSRLLAVSKENGSLKHGHFTDIVSYLKKGDCLVLNDTRVIPARLYGVKEETGAKIEFLLLNRKNQTDWEVILKPGKKAKPGAKFVFGDGLLKAEVLENVLEENNKKALETAKNEIVKEITLQTVLYYYTAPLSRNIFAFCIEYQRKL